MSNSWEKRVKDFPLAPKKSVSQAALTSKGATKSKPWAKRCLRAIGKCPVENKEGGTHQKDPLSFDLTEYEPPLNGRGKKGKRARRGGKGRRPKRKSRTLIRRRRETALRSLGEKQRPPLHVIDARKKRGAQARMRKGGRGGGESGDEGGPEICIPAEKILAGRSVQPEERKKTLDCRLSELTKRERRNDGLATKKKKLFLSV